MANLPLNESLVITVFVMIMLALVEYFTFWKRIPNLSGERKNRYLLSSLLGAAPGCLGAFLAVSLYLHRYISLGSITATMLSTSGDEAFVMLLKFPRKAFFLFSVLFLLGWVLGWVADRIFSLLKIQPYKECELTQPHPGEERALFSWKILKKNLSSPSLLRFSLIFFLLFLFLGTLRGWVGPEEEIERILFLSTLGVGIFIFLIASSHYLEEHFLSHIVKEHLWKTFLWVFGTLALLEIGNTFFDLKGFVENHPGWILLIACTLGFLPTSGPHLIFVFMFAQGSIPFSILLASSLAQDGHGMLPLFSYSIKDAVVIKIFNFFSALGIGGLFYLLRW